MKVGSADAALELWKLLSAGKLDDLRAKAWKID
jgi:hypothetical protein